MTSDERSHRPTQWELRVVGESVLLTADGRECDLSAKSKRFAVLVFLALPSPGRWVRRDVLLATFWPELDALRARNALRSTLHQLRNTLGPEAICRKGDEELALDSDHIRVDLVELLAALDRCDPSGWLSRTSLELVPGLHVPDATPFHEWLDAQRHALNALVVSTAWRITDRAEGTQDFDRALAAARLATRLAPEDEPGRRRLISLLDRRGDRAGALAEFEHFETWLHEEFQASPAPETLALVRRVRERTQSSHDIALDTAAGESGVARPLASNDPGVQREASARAPTQPPPAATQPRMGRLRPRLRAGAVIALVAATGVWALTSKGTNPAASVPVAILPFTDEIRDSTLAYFTPALAESIADDLAPGVTVPFEATRAIDGTNRRTAVERLHALGARTVVSGTVHRDGEAIELRMTIQSADRASVVGRLTFRRTDRELGRLRDTAVAEIRRLLGIPARMVVNGHVPAPEALQLHYNARYLLARRSREALLAARELYKRALDIDPQWAELWIGMARVTGSLAYRHFIDYRSGLRESEHDANEALLRAPHDARALIERALARFQLGDNVGAEADAKRAAALDSTDWHMQSLIGTWWQWSGSHLDSALFYTERARRLAPWDRQTAINILQIVGCMPDSLAIIERARQVLDMDPNEPEALETLAWTLSRFGRWEEATQRYEQRFASVVASGVTAPLTHLTGEARFRATVRAIRQAAYDDQKLHPPATIPLLESRIALFEDLGMRDSSIATLAAVVDSLDVHHANMMCAPNLRGFRKDPRTLAIVKQRGWQLAEFASLP